MTVGGNYIFAFAKLLFGFSSQFQEYVISPAIICCYQAFAIQIEFKDIIMRVFQVGRTVAQIFVQVEFTTYPNVRFTFPRGSDHRSVWTSESCFSGFPTIGIVFDVCPVSGGLLEGVVTFPYFIFNHWEYSLQRLFSHETIYFSVYTDSSDKRMFGSGPVFGTSFI